MAKISIFSIDFHNLAKLFNRGRIDKVYARMYAQACELAVFESMKFKEGVKPGGGAFSKRSLEEYFDKLLNFQQERINYHMAEMKDLLILHLKEQRK